MKFAVALFTALLSVSTAFAGPAFTPGDLDKPQAAVIAKLENVYNLGQQLPKSEETLKSVTVLADGTIVTISTRNILRKGSASKTNLSQIQSLSAALSEVELERTEQLAVCEIVAPAFRPELSVAGSSGDLKLVWMAPSCVYNVLLSPKSSDDIELASSLNSLLETLGSQVSGL